LSTHATAENPDSEKERYLNTMSVHSIPLSEISDRIHKICGTEKTYLYQKFRFDIIFGTKSHLFIRDKPL